MEENKLKDLETPTPNKSNADEVSIPIEGEKKGRWMLVGAEVKKQLWLAGPLIGAGLLQSVLQVISVMFVGHLGELPLSGASLATSFAMVTGYTVMIGMGGALETLCGQSYGAKQHKMLGVHLQRAMLVMTLVAVPVVVVWFFSADILRACKQDPAIAAEAGTYARWLIPALFAHGLLQCLTRFLQTQNIVFPMLLTSGFVVLLHTLACWVLVFKAGLGGKGAALATAISQWTNVCLLALYVKFSSSCKNTWCGFSKKAFGDVLNFIKLAIPSAIMFCSEGWAFELLVLLSGLLPNPKLETSVLSICLNTIMIIFMFPSGLGSAVSTRVSNELGAGRPRAARMAVGVVVGLVIIQGVLVGAFLVSIRKVWGHAYSNDMEVVKYVAVMLPFVALSNFLDGLQSVLSGTARGCGWQNKGAFVNLAAYYVVGVPCAIIFDFVLHMRGKGLLIGIICGLFVQTLMLAIITLRIDWDKQAKKAKERVYSTTIPTNNAS